jgi:hypothetical protein
LGSVRAADGGVMSSTIVVAHDPSVAVRRRHLPKLRLGRKGIVP